MNETSEQPQKKCYHDNLVAVYDQWWEHLGDGDQSISEMDLVCPDCGKRKGDMWDDPKDIDPTCKPSQQPRGDNTYSCNQHGYVKPTTWQGESVCPYHQRVHHGEEGPEFLWDEFNQDGEEW